jgi:predicted  nucleic acid-binding Zn-ribbon protein
VEQQYVAQVSELKKTMVADLQRMQEEVKKHFSQQKAETTRLQQHVMTLKGEKTALQQQVLGLQRRIQDLEESIGSE